MIQVGRVAGVVDQAERHVDGVRLGRCDREPQPVRVAHGAEGAGRIIDGRPRVQNADDPARDVALWVREDDAVRGFVAIWALRDDPAEARLRWFILDDALRGRGLGRALIAAAMEHCRNVGFRRVELFTFAALTAARALYREAGFRLIEEREHADWGAPIILERFELLLD